MHVTDGVTPMKADTNVRFRTTYYFRVFDYCWSGDANIDADHTYQKIVPETDTLYRYRMTGKASALANQIRFESGMLRKEQIDPFGTRIVYNRDTGDILHSTPEEAKRRADAAAAARRDAAERDQALTDFEALATMLAREKDEATRTQITAAMKVALDKFLKTYRAPPDPEIKTKVEGLEARVKSLEDKLAQAGQEDDEDLAKLRTELTAMIEEVKREVAALRTRTVTTLDQFCSIGEIQRRGFQIMGPQGMRPFDQDARLIMAMHSSAKPLIETLSEYSGRLLKPRVNAAEQLLPLARETTTVVRTQRTLDRAALQIAEEADARPAVGQVFDAALQTFAEAR